MSHQKLRRLLGTILVLVLVFSASAQAFAEPDWMSVDLDAIETAPDCTLLDTQKYLVLEAGQRFRGTPNEHKAAQFMYDSFTGLGYADVVHHEPALTGTLTSVSRIDFQEGPDILGNATPNTDAFGTGGRFTGALVDLGTYAADYTAPAGLTGDVVGAIRFTAAPTGAAIDAIVAAFVAANPDATLTGLMTTRSDTAAMHLMPAANVSGITSGIQVLGTSFTNFNRALQLPYLTGLNMPEEERGNVALGADRKQYGTTNVVIARKPAATDDPDMVMVFSAHLDSVLSSVGSNDNASSSSALIELARRFKDVDNGNIEIWFASVGSEEGNGMRGSVYTAEMLIAEGKRDIAINLNMDMLASSLTAMTNGAWGNPINEAYLLNAVSMDINVSLANLTLNLPSYLVTDRAKDVEWVSPPMTATETTPDMNVRIYQYGGSDHVQFHNRGIDAASMIVVRNSDDYIENAAFGYHSGADNLVQNYSYERHLMCTNLMANALSIAINDKVSKRARFGIYETVDGTKEARLHNADQLFTTFDRVAARFTGVDSGTIFDVDFTQGAPKFTLPIDEDYTVSNVVAHGTGIADNWDAARNERLQNMRVNLKPSVEAIPLTLLDKEVKAAVTRTIGSQNFLLITLTEYFSDGAVVDTVKMFKIDNNAAGTYEVGDHSVYVDTKGNIQIRELEFVPLQLLQ